MTQVSKSPEFLELVQIRRDLHAAHAALLKTWGLDVLSPQQTNTQLVEFQSQTDFERSMLALREVQDAILGNDPGRSVEIEESMKREDLAERVGEHQHLANLLSADIHDSIVRTSAAGRVFRVLPETRELGDEVIEIKSRLIGVVERFTARVTNPTNHWQALKAANAAEEIHQVTVAVLEAADEIDERLVGYMSRAEASKMFESTHRVQLAREEFLTELLGPAVAIEATAAIDSAGVTLS